MTDSLDLAIKGYQRRTGFEEFKAIQGFCLSVFLMDNPTL